VLFPATLLRIPILTSLPFPSIRQGRRGDSAFREMGNSRIRVWSQSARVVTARTVELERGAWRRVQSVCLPCHTEKDNTTRSCEHDVLKLRNCWGC